MSTTTTPVTTASTPSIPCHTACADCTTCTRYRTEGWYGGGSHCGDTYLGARLEAGCHRSWTGTAQSHCKTCHGQFTSHTVGDKHHAFCGPDGTSGRMEAALTKNGDPVFARRDDGVWSLWAPDGYWESLRP